jgi:mycoredoxin
MTDTASERAHLIIYTASWCGPCARLKSRLTERSIAFDEIDVEQDPSAAEWVVSVNGGNQTVPTVRFPDGSALTNPSVDAVVERLGLPAP